MIREISDNPYPVGLGIETITDETPVSVIIVTYHSEKTILPCLFSLEKSLRPRDEVIIVDNDSTDKTVDVIASVIRRMPQIKLYRNPSNIGYSRAINRGIIVSKNAVIVFLNPDTIVTSKWINRLLFHIKPEKIAAVGPLSNYVGGMQNISLYLKDDTSPLKGLDSLAELVTLRFSQQSIRTKLLIGFCMMVKKKVLNHLGMLDESLFLGNDDLDISLRMRNGGYEILIAKDCFVYHKGQESFRSRKKDATDRLVQESTDRLFYKLMRSYGTKIPSPEILWGINWFRPSCLFSENTPLTSIVILTFNQRPLTQICVESLFRHTHAPFELIFVDNGSGDDTLYYLKSLRREKTSCVGIRIIENNENKGFSVGNNQGMAASYGEYLLLLNNDTIVTPGWLNGMIRHLERQKEIGLVGPVSNHVSGPQKIDTLGYDTLTCEGLDLFSVQWKEQNKDRMEISWRLVGFCILMRRAVIETIGGFDIRFKTGNFEDDDFCVRANLAGFKAVIARDVFIHHFGSQTFLANRIDFNAAFKYNWRLFRSKWNILSEELSKNGYVIPPQKGGFDPLKHYCPYKEEDFNMEENTR